MSDDKLSKSVACHFAGALEMLEAAVTAFPTDNWRQQGALRPAGAALHILEAIEFYTSGKSVADFPWGHRFGVDWEGASPEELPNQHDIKIYLGEVKEQLNNWLAQTDLVSPETDYQWTGPTVAARCIYVLRNTQHHLGELSLALKELGLAPPEWR